MNTHDARRDDGNFDVLGVYLETLRAQMAPRRFRTLVAAVQMTCGLLSDGPATPVTVSGDCFLPSDLRREYVSVLAVMITGRMDHSLVEVPVAGGPPGWAVLEAGAHHGPAALQAAGRRFAGRHDEQMSLAAGLEGIARASGLTPN
ncbi:hypothetical protein [Streptomyces xanthophaeus]|uniref:hypothetical protein n=1 Tax=Streptomyces xanthophaeus TaxID=67385 RepID=UPI003659CA48